MDDKNITAKRTFTLFYFLIYKNRTLKYKIYNCAKIQSKSNQIQNPTEQTTIDQKVKIKDVRSFFLRKFLDRSSFPPILHHISFLLVIWVLQCQFTQIKNCDEIPYNKH